MRPGATSATVNTPTVTGLLSLMAAVQTQPKQPLHAMRMITFVNAAAMLTLALFYTIPRMLCLKRPSPQTEVRSYQAWVVQPLLASCVQLCRACEACSSTDLLALELLNSLLRCRTALMPRSLLVRSSAECSPWGSVCLYWQQAPSLGPNSRQRTWCVQQHVQLRASTCWDPCQETVLDAGAARVHVCALVCVALGVLRAESASEPSLDSNHCCYPAGSR